MEPVEVLEVRRRTATYDPHACPLRDANVPAVILEEMVPRGARDPRDRQLVSHEGGTSLHVAVRRKARPQLAQTQPRRPRHLHEAGHQVAGMIAGPRRAVIRDPKRYPAAPAVRPATILVRYA